MNIVRKYALTKIGKGDYLCPGNDAQMVYRFSRYEDGPSMGLMDWPRDREVWRVRRAPLPTDGFFDPEYAKWRDVSECHATRKEALASVFGWPEHLTDEHEKG